MSPAQTKHRNNQARRLSPRHESLIRSRPFLGSLRVLAGLIAALWLTAGCATGGSPEMEAYAARQKERISETRLSNGIPLILQDAPESSAAVLRVVFTGRDLLPEEGKDGITALTLSLMARGSREHTYEDVQALLYRRSASISPSAGSPEAAAISMKALPRHFEPTLELYRELLLHPRWDSEEWKRLRQDYLMARQQRENNPYQRTRLLAREAFFEDHPYGSAPGGTMESLHSLSLEELRDHYRRLLRPDNMLLVLTGPLESLRKEGKSPQELLEESFGSLDGKTEADSQAAASNPIPEDFPAAGSQMIREPFSQLPGLAYVHGCYPMPPAGHPDRPALTVAYAVWKDLLFEFLRTRHSLCYSTWASLGGQSAGYGSLTIYQTSQPNQAVAYVDEARQALLEGKAAAAEISTRTSLKGSTGPAGGEGNGGDENLPPEAPDRKTEKEADSLVPLEEVLSFYKDQYLTSFYQDQQSIGSIGAQAARAYRLTGNPRTYLDWPRKIQALTPEDIQRAAQRWLSDPEITWVLLGDEKILRDQEN